MALTPTYVADTLDTLVKSKEWTIYLENPNYFGLATVQFKPEGFFVKTPTRTMSYSFQDVVQLSREVDRATNEVKQWNILISTMDMVKFVKSPIKGSPHYEK